MVSHPSHPQQSARHEVSARGANVLQAFTYECNMPDRTCTNVFLIVRSPPAYFFDAPPPPPTTATVVEDAERRHGRGPGSAGVLPRRRTPVDRHSLAHGGRRREPKGEGIGRKPATKNPTPKKRSTELRQEIPQANSPRKEKPQAPNVKRAKLKPEE